MNKNNNLLKQIANLCDSKRLSLVTAESCTGGGLAYTIVMDSNCSSLLERGYVTYSLIAKKDILNVSDYTLQIYGAVSKQTALEMAQKALQASKAQVSVAITGIDATTCEEITKKSLGVVWISCAAINKSAIAKEFKLAGKRQEFSENAINKALKMLLDYIS